MNERIDKLLVKAGAYFGGDGIDYSRFDAKKFAELIVRECADLCTNPLDTEDILEHFGVPPA